MARPASDIRHRLIVSARTRFLHEGVDGASLRQIARDAGTNIGMVYYYFKTKDELFLAVVQDVYGVLLEDMAQSLQGDAPEEQRFAALYERLSRLSEEELQVLRMLIREALASSPRLKELGNLFLHGHVPLLLGHLGRGIQEQRLRGDLPPTLLMAASFLLGLMPQVIRRVVSPLDARLEALLPTPEQIAHGMAQILFHGISHDPQPTAAGKERRS
jgi:AcrR family transcriptional regulator